VSVPRIPDLGRLVVSVLTPAKEAADSALPRLCNELGAVEEEIGPLPFGYTSYYEAEMGPGIRRWMWVFAELVDRGRLARIKLLTNGIESAYSRDGKRRFNLDPGLLNLENFVLATGKNRAHRIYLGDGIFGDLTLLFSQGSYRPLPWTYPDYADPELIKILNGVRERYRCMLRLSQGRTVRSEV